MYLWGSHFSYEWTCVLKCLRENAKQTVLRCCSVMWFKVIQIGCVFLRKGYQSLFWTTVSLHSAEWHSTKHSKYHAHTDGYLFLVCVCDSGTLIQPLTFTWKCHGVQRRGQGQNDQQKACGSRLKEELGMGYKRASKYKQNRHYTHSQISLYHTQVLVVTGYPWAEHANLAQRHVCSLCMYSSTLQPLEFILSMVLFTAGLVGSMSSTWVRTLLST